MKIPYFLKKLLENELTADIRQIVYFMRMTGVRLRFFSQSLVLSLGLIIFNMYTVTLLFPLSHGIIENNFDHVKNLKLLGWIARHYPHVFSNSFRLFILLLVWIYLTLIIKNLLRYAAFLSTHYQSKIASIKLRNILLDRCLSYSKNFYDRNKISDIHKIVINSTDIIKDQFKIFLSLIIESFLIIMYFIIMMNISWKLTLISLVCFPAFDMLTRTMINRIRRLMAKYRKALPNLNDRVYNILNCISLVKGFTKEEQEKAYFAKVNEDEINQSYKIQKIANLISPIQDMGATTTVLIIALGMAFIIHFDHSLNASGVFVFFYLAAQIIPGLNAINNFKLGMLLQGKGVQDINNIIEGNSYCVVKSGQKIFLGLKKAIEIKDLSFQYLEKREPVLRGINLTIPKGKMTAIVGPTGSGKSTIANLLLRFYDCREGTIFIDDVDIHEYAIKSLRKRMSFVEQDLLLFNDTIRNNITYANHDDTSDELLKKISVKIIVDDFVQKLPHQYETMVEDKGGNLSDGERQRISIARALLRDHDILIMDEPTSGLDAETEQKIAQSLAQMSQGKTIVVISHRLSTIKNADHIIYIEKGQALESGTLQEMLEKKGLFYKQWEAQKI